MKPGPTAGAAPRGEPGWERLTVPNELRIERPCGLIRVQDREARVNLERSREVFARGGAIAQLVVNHSRVKEHKRVARAQTQGFLRVGPRLFVLPRFVERPRQDVGGPDIARLPQVDVAGLRHRIVELEVVVGEEERHLQIGVNAFGFVKRVDRADQGVLLLRLLLPAGGTVDVAKRRHVLGYGLSGDYLPVERDRAVIVTTGGVYFRQAGQCVHVAGKGLERGTVLRLGGVEIPGVEVEIGELEMIPRLALGRCAGVSGAVHGLLGEADRLLRVAPEFGQMGETAQHRRGLSDAIKVVVSGLRLVIPAEFKIVVTNQSERLRGTWIERIYALSGRKGVGEVVLRKLHIGLVTDRGLVFRVQFQGLLDSCVSAAIRVHIADLSGAPKEAAGQLGVTDVVSRVTLDAAAPERDEFVSAEHPAGGGVSRVRYGSRSVIRRGRRTAAETHMRKEDDPGHS